MGYGHPRHTIHDVYLEKVLDQIDQRQTTEAMEIGNYAESPLIDWCCKKIDATALRNQRRVAKCKILASNVDALLLDRNEGIEAKSTSRPDEYGAEMSDEVPVPVMLQCNHHMYCAGLDVVWVPLLTVEYGFLSFRLFRVPRSDTIIESIVETDHRFWHDHVLPKVPPDDFMPSMETLRRIRREPNKTVEIPEDLARAYEINRLDCKAADETFDMTRRAILAAMGDAEAGVVSGLGMFTFFEQRSPPKYDRTAMVADGVFEQYATIGSHRVLRWKAEKE